MRWLNALRGIVRLWFFDIGSASFLGTAVLAFGLMLLLATGSKLEAMPMMLGMVQVSTSAAIAWQFNRLAATEWAVLVPHYRHNVLIQAAFIGTVATVMSIIASLVMRLPDGVEQVLLATFAGLGFIYFCHRRIKGFYFSFFLFLLLPFLGDITNIIPGPRVLILVIANAAMIGLLWREIKTLSWHSEARTVYLNGLEMGWFWLPSFGSFPFMSRLDRFLHPVNFFLGPMLSMILVTMPVIALLVTLANYVADIELPVLFILSQFSAVCCSMVHWSRVQRWRAVETLYMLPGFDGKLGMVEAFAAAQYRLLALLTLTIAVIATLVGLLNEGFTFVLWSHVVLSTFCACALLLGFGCAAKGAIHITMTMLVVVAHSVWLSSSLIAIRDGEEIIYWLFVDIGLVAFSMLTLWWGKKKLWNDDLA
ncbi:hypothetical protein [Shewanella colwelliana]|uniref:hypothetical protein n=1 Tax=Shewanella colwelliana TaxID=23 RepID=UPI0022AF75D0|nr:hypothetical protein [Shewanella colwelliana]MCZ4339305.1 hypothetical protein [Shewanella colwelliana]